MYKEKYIKIQLGEDSAFIRFDSLEKLEKVDAIVFDCDGVIIDATKSYLSSIKETVNYIFSRLTGASIEDQLLDKMIYILKKGGDFNNDWAVSYTMSLLTLTLMPKQIKEEFVRTLDSKHFNNLKNPLDKLLFVEKSLSNEYINFEISKDSLLRLIELTKKISLSGKYFEKILFSDSSILQSNIHILRSGKKLLSYPGEVGEGLLITIFEEIFLGCELFKNIYSQDCLFHKSRGLIEKEEVLLEKEALQKISTLIGRANFGIASGRPFIASEYSMGELLDYFKPESRVFLDDIDKAEKDAKHNGKEGELSKPNPYSLLKCATNLMPFKFALYLGDSMADFLMVELANKIESRYLFCGVYSHFVMSEEQKLDFIKKGADIIIPSVRHLPYILKCIKEGKDFA